MYEESNLDAVDPDELAEGTEQPVESEEAVAETTPTTAVPAGPTEAEQRYARENAWLRQVVADSTSRIDALTAQLEEFEVRDLPEDEAAFELVRRREERLAKREQELQAAEHRREWKDYFRNFDVPEEVLAGDDPVQWQHGVLTHQRDKIVELLDTVAALKKVQEQSSTPKPTKVTSKQTGTTPHKTLWDYDLNEILKMGEQARFGLLKSEDLPPLE